jgi:hypothetical protein
MKDKKAIKKDVLDQFRDMGEDAMQVLSHAWLEEYAADILSKDEKKLFDQAVKELVGKGLVEFVGNQQKDLKLTEKGANLIF